LGATATVHYAFQIDEKRMPLILEQLEDRIFLDANPMVVVDDPQPTTDVSPDDTVMAVAPEAEEKSQAVVVENEPDTSGEEEAPDVEQGDAAELVTIPAVQTSDPGVAVAADNESPSEDSLPEEPAASEAAEEVLIELIDPMIGEDFSFTYSFENELAQTGYGPYVDIYFPTSGDDGDHPGPQPPGSDVYDGIKFVSASYLGTSVTAIEQTFDATGQLEHAFAKDSNGDALIITGQEGDTFVTLQLPFGSYTPQQPAADIVITAHMSNLAEVDLPLNITTSSGFMYGADPLANPTTDPSLANQADHTTAWLPEVIRFEKTYVGPENETATGPNYPRKYSITVDVADGQTVDNLKIIDTLPTNIVYLGNVTGANVTGSTLVGNVLTIDLANSGGSFVGGAGTDTTVTFDYYVGDILPGCTTSVDITNNMQLEADWDPLDDRDPAVHLVVNAEVYNDGTISGTPDVDEVFEAQPIVIQKSVTNITDAVNSPGDIVRYTLEFQVSDYHALGNIEIQDLMSDGISFYTDPGTYDPSFTIQDKNGNYIADFIVGTDLELTARPDLGDETQIDFHISQAIITAGDADGVLEGGRTASGDGIAALGTIVYYGKIDEYYTSPNVPIDQGDTLNNSVQVSADRYNYTGVVLDAAPACSMSNVDNSSADVEMPVGGVVKTLYAVDHVLVGGATDVHVSPGSEVTYRLTYTLPTSDFYDLDLEDYLPLPIFDADDPDHDGVTDVWNSYFTAQAITDAIGGATPAVGQAMFGPSETFFTYSGLVPNVDTNGAQNELLFDWDSYYNVGHTQTTVDILFTVEVSTEPFTDGLFLTNQVQAIEDGNHTSTTTTDIVQIVLDEPELEITKGVIATDNGDGVFTAAVGPVAFSAPGVADRWVGNITESGLDTTQIDADLTDIDAGDLVSFGITVRNVGHYAAYDIHIDDDLPSGFELPGAGLGLNLSVTDGSGAILPYSGDLFGAGLTITNPLAGNDDGDNNQFDNILIITYDLLSQDVVEPLQEIINTAELTHYAAAPGASNFIPEGLEDEASVVATAPEVDKGFDLVNGLLTPSYTNQLHTSDPDVAIGELVYYETEITVPEGTTTSVSFVDQLDDGLAFVDFTTVTISASAGLEDGSGMSWNGYNLTTDVNNILSFNDVNHSFTLDFGDLVNTDRNNAVDETITVTYSAVVLNSTTNDRGDTLNNNAQWSWVENGNTHTENDRAPNVTIVEPTLEVVKEVDNDPGAGTDWVTVATGLDQGDNVDYRITVHHTGASDADAFNAEFSDTLPGGIDWSGVAVAVQSDTAGITSWSIVGGVLTAQWNEFAMGDSTTFIVSGGLLASATAGQSIVNTGEVTWTSLPGNVTAPQSVHSTLSTERTGDPTDPGGAANDYLDNDDATVTVTGSIDKVNNGTYTIGETHTYDITVSLPEGDTQSLVVTDLLPAGLVVDNVNTDIVVDDTGFGGTVNNTPTITYAGNTLSIDFGDVSVTADNNPANNSFLIQLLVRVDNVASNVDGIPSLENHVSMTYGATPTTIHDPTDPTVDIVEPQITTTKTVVDASGDQTVAALGEIVTYTVRFENTGNSTAFEVDALDAMDPGTNFVSLDSVTYHDTSLATDTDILGQSYATDNGNETVNFGSLTPFNSWDIEVGDYVEIVYSAQVAGAWFVSGSHVNTIDADWTGLDGVNPNERIYDDGVTAPGSPVDGNQDRDSASYTVPQGNLELGDTVWFDANNNGVQDVGELGISGVRVDTEVDLGGGTVYQATAITDGNGEYLFTNLHAATYIVTVDTNTLPNGLTQTYELPDGGPLDHATSVDLAGGNSPFMDADFGYTGIGSIGNYVWYDANQDGNQDANEMSIAGVRVDLEGDLDGDGTYEFTATDITDANGSYLFENLPFVNYTVTVDQATLPFALTTPTWDRDGTLDHTTGVTLTNGTPDVLDADFGYVGSGQIGNFIWDDHNADGIQDGGAETGFANVTVTLSADLDGDANPDFTLQTVTDAAGAYLFDVLPEGDYTITVNSGTLPSGYIQSGDPDGTLDSGSQVTLASGSMTDLTQDFGYTKTGSIGDTVWYDANANSNQDAGEPGLAGVTVTLLGDVDLDGNPDTLTTTTNSSGQYLFDTLPTGNYTITVAAGTLPGGMRQTYDADGIATADTADVALGYGEDNLDIDFGYTGTGSIGDTVWFDANRNAVLDGGESGISNVLMTLNADFNSDGVIDYTIDDRTDSNGKYLFENLPAGNYTITLDPSTLPPGLMQTYDPDSLMDGTSRITLGAGEKNLVQDFAYALPPDPLVPPQPPEPQQPEFPETPERYEGGDDDGYDVDDFLEGPALSQRTNAFQPALTSMAAMYTGHAEPGTMLYLTLQDSQGNVLATHMAPTDTGGNWLANFQMAPDSDTPHKVVIEQSTAVYNRSTEGGFNLRTNFSPSFGSKAVTSIRGDVTSVMGGSADRVVENLHRLYNGQLDVRWDSTSPYESSVTSTSPGQSSSL
jgi:fimbrial isopeptide formation D2 family protein/uncharacterized repeat protein (TIGR01451 family)